MSNPIPADSNTTTRPGLVSRPSSVATMHKTIILVTGGNAGIGFEIVKSLSKNSNYQILMGCRNTSKGEAAASTLGAPANVNPIQLDITSDESIEHCVKTIQQLFGRLDVLVNNAGTAGADLSRDGHKPTNRETWQHIINTNVTSTGVFTDAMIPLLEKSKLPKIVFLSSSLGSIGWLQAGETLYPGLSYNASKSAVNMMTAFYARVHPQWKVNCVCPGYRATGLNGAELNDDTDPALGAVNVVRLINEGPEGVTGTYSRSAEQILPW